MRMRGLIKVVDKKIISKKLLFFVTLSLVLMLPFASADWPVNLFLQINSSDYWDNLDTPSDIPGSEFWYNFSLIPNAGDTNETTRFGALVDGDCSGSDKMIGVQTNGTVFCTSTAGGGDFSFADFQASFLLNMTVGNQTILDITNITNFLFNYNQTLAVFDGDQLNVSINQLAASSTNIFDQVLNTTSNVIFNQINVTDEILLKNKFNVSLAIANSMGNGLVDGGIITQGTDPAKFDVSASKSWFVNNTNPIPNLEYVICPAFDEVTLTNLATDARTDIALQRDCTLAQKSGDAFTNEQRRSNIVLGRLIHPDNLVILNIVNLQHYALGMYDQYLDFTHAVGNINTAGNIYSPALGTGLNITHTSGRIFRIGANYINSKDNPNEVVQSLDPQASFFYFYQDGSGGFSQSASAVTQLDNQFYDDGSGTLASVPNKKYVITRVYLFSDNSTVLQYGQAFYNKLAEATAAISTESFNAVPNLESNAVLRGWIILKEDASDLTDANKFKIINAGKFGSLGGATGTSAAEEVDLQNVYDNSFNGSILLDSTRDGLKIFDNPTSLDGTMFGIYNATNFSILNFNTTGDLNIGGFYYGDGSKLTGIAVGGDFSFTDFQNSYNINVTNIFDQVVNTTSSVTFANINASSIVNIAGNLNVSSGGNTLFVNVGLSRVGIGDASPDALLDVGGNARVDGNLTVSSGVSGGALIFSNGFAVAPSGSGVPFIYRSGTSSLSYPFNNFGNLIIQPGTAGGDDIVFMHNDAGAETLVAMIISDEGRVGIGTTAPTGVLHVVGGQAAIDTAGIGIILTAENSGTGTGSEAGGDITLTSGDALTDTGTSGSINFEIPAAFLTADMNFDIGGASGQAGHFVFTGGSGATPTFDTRFIITDADVGIGTTTPADLLNVVGGGINMSTHGENLTIGGSQMNYNGSTLQIRVT